MLLTLEELRSIACGAVNVREEGDGFHFYRFTDAQMDMYKAHSAEFFIKAQASANIRLSFTTDSEYLDLAATLSTGSSRTFFSFDVYVNGKPLDYLDNYSHEALPENYPSKPYALGRHEKHFDLGPGEKSVTVYFPWSVTPVIESVALAEGASLKPLRPQGKMIIFGDSITHGYDAQAPSQSYANRVSFQTDSEAVNLAIGGACFAADCLDESIDYRPDMIVVAYGTNDWRKKPAEACFAGCRAFFDKLCKIYPDKPIFYILPIWRHRGCETPEQTESFWLSRNLFKHIASGYKNIKIIDLWEEIPRDLSLFSDGLHPNSEGFAYYANGVIKHLNFEDKE